MMSENNNVYGKCARCGGNLTNGHNCVPLVIIPPVIRKIDILSVIQESNTDLQRQLDEQKAMVNELRSGLETLASQLEAEIRVRQKKTGRRQLGKEGALRRVDRILKLFDNEPHQSLAHIEARVEEETVERCAVQANQCADYEYPRLEFSDSIRRLPRKYTGVK